MNAKLKRRFSMSAKITIFLYRKWPSGVGLLFLIPAWTYAQSVPIKLNGPLVDGGDVRRTVVSPNSDRVVYSADQNEDSVNELYSVPIGGGVPTQLTGPLSGDRDVSSLFRIAADGSHVVFLGDLEANGDNELFSVPIAGGAVSKLNDPLPANGDINSFMITPDSSRVIYTGDQTTDGVVELYSVPVTGGTVIRLNDPVAGGDRVLFTPVISPDSSRVVFIADQNGDRVDELYSVPVGGGVVTKLNGSLVDGGDVMGLEIDISADSSTVVYVARQDVPTVQELYSVPISGGIATKISGPSASDRNVFDFEIGADSLRVVFFTSQATSGLTGLFSVPIAGGAVTQLSDLAGGELFDYQIAGGGNAVVFTFNTDSVTLFSVPVDGGAIIPLNTPLAQGEEVGGFELTEDTNTAVYTVVPVGNVADKAAATKGIGPLTTALFSVPVGGGLAIRLIDAFDEGRGVTNFEVSNDGALVVYRANLDEAQAFELFGVPILGGAAVKFNAPLVDGGNVGRFVVSPDNNRVIYDADQDTDDVRELFSVSRGGLGRPDELFVDGFE